MGSCPPPQRAKSPLVCIVGAGMTGICACKHLLQHGIQPVVLEAQPGVGGVWRHTFASTKLQTPRDAYQFSDYTWPPGTPDYPSHTDVKEYLRSYACNFDVMDCIRFNCKVVQIRQLNEPLDELHSSRADDARGLHWAVCVQSSSSDKHMNAEGDLEWLFFDFLVLCIGRYGDIPKLPAYPASKGPEIFQGKVLHSMEYAKLDDCAAKHLLQDKRVVVIGMMKSALDVAVEASNANQGIRGHPCTVIFRAAHWMLPHHEPFGLPLSYLYSTRLSELMIPKPDQGFLLSVISTLLTPARWAISKLVEKYLLHTLPLRELGLVPNQTFFEQFASCQVPLLPDAFFQRVKDGQINLLKAESWSFSKSGVVLGDRTSIEADVVILCTGYDGEKKLRSLLQPVTRELQNFGSVIPLYRGVIHPRIPHLAIMGFHENLSNLHSAEMGARWLAHLLSQKISLPSIGTMETVTQKWIEYMRNATPFYQKSCIGAVSIWHSDQVCQDLGWNPRRKRNFFQELLAPYSNMDYKD
ncbi:hypothetical protein GOP47_0019822 [Adiantum capillus-veneris]|uniref:Flavin-containing monooxygenase n=1 Tax=Adiantum capillus-veneris TaxID=13818 RepID=A0A9D4UCI0_ADICA|nr:hypothetical protein GOP47_0019822 [Adiantum capillus-veneris]